MSLASNAIGFSLGLEDNLNPALARAEKSYISLTSSIERLNKQAFASASKFSSGFAASLDELDKLPKRVAASVLGMQKAVQKALKPIKQPVQIQFVANDVKNFGKTLGMAIGRALSIFKFKTVSLKDGGIVGTSGSLADQDRQIKSIFDKMPRFAKGGIVPPTNLTQDEQTMLGLRGADNSPIVATVGEKVLPPGASTPTGGLVTMEQANATPVTAIKSMMELSAESGKLVPSIERLVNFLSTEAPKLQEIHSKHDQTLYRGILQDKLADLNAMLGKSNDATNQRFAKSLSDITQAITGVKPSTIAPAIGLAANEPVGRGTITDVSPIKPTESSAAPSVVTPVTPVNDAALYEQAQRQMRDRMSGIVEELDKTERGSTLAEGIKTQISGGLTSSGGPIPVNVVQSIALTVANMPAGGVGHGGGPNNLNKTTVAMNNLGNATAKTTKHAKEAETVWDALLKNFLGPARFLATSRALNSVTAGLGKLADVSHQWFGEGTRELQDYVVQFNNINKLMGLSRSELRVLKNDIAQDATRWKGAFDLSEAAEGYAALRAAGLTDTKLLKDLYPAITALKVGTDASLESLAQYFKELHYGTKIGEGDMKDLAASMEEYSKRTGASMEELVKDATDATDRLSDVLAKEQPEVQKTILDNWTKFSASLHGANVDATGKLRELVASAAEGDNDASIALGRLTNMNLNRPQLEAMLKDKDKGLAPIIAGIQAKATSMTGPSFAQNVKNFMPDLDEKSIARIQAHGKEIIDGLHGLNDASVQAGKGMDGLIDKANVVNTTWARWINATKNSVEAINVFGYSVVDVVDALKEFGVVNIASSVYLFKQLPTWTALKTGVVAFTKGLWGAITGMGSWIKSLFVATTGEAALGDAGIVAAAGVTAGKDASIAAAIPTTALGTKSGIAAGEVAALGEASVVAGGEIEAVGVAGATAATGIGAFIASIGVGTGTAIEAVLTGIGGGLISLSVGLEALYPALPVIGALTLALIGVAFALRLVDPLLEKSLDVFDDMFKTFVALDPSKMFAAALAMGAIGLAFPALGAGVFAGSTLLLAAVPNLVLVSGALYLFAGSSAGETTGIAAAVDAIAAAFTVDKTKLDAAIDAVDKSGKLVVGLVDLGNEMSGLGLSSLDSKSLIWMLSGPLGLIDSFFMSDPVRDFTDHSKQIAASIVSISAAFAGIDPTGLLKASAVIKPIGEFVAGVSQIDKAVMDLAPQSGVLGAISDFLVGSDFEKLANLQSKSAAISNTLQFLITDVSKWLPDDPAVIKKMEGVTANLKIVGEFVGGYAKVIEGFEKIVAFSKPGLFSNGSKLDKAINSFSLLSPASAAIWKALKMAFGGRNSKDVRSDIKASAEGIKQTIKDLVEVFSDKDFVSLTSQSDAAKKGIGFVADVFSWLTPMFESEAKATTAALSIPGGGVRYWGDGPITANLKTMQRGFIDDKGNDGPITASLKGINKAADGIVLSTTKTNIDNITGVFGSINQMFNAMWTEYKLINGLPGDFFPKIGDGLDALARSMVNFVPDWSALNVDAGAAGALDATKTNIDNLAHVIDSITGLFTAYGKLGAAISSTADAVKLVAASKDLINEAFTLPGQLIQNIRQNVSTPPVTPEQLSAVTTVTISGTVDTRDQTLYDKIDALTAAVVANGGSGGGGGKTNTSAGPSDWTQNWSQGRTGY